MNDLDGNSLSRQEQLSALFDGQLSAAQAAALVRASLDDDSLMLQWRSMSATQHVLSGQQAPAERLPAQQLVMPTAAQPIGLAANDGVFRWKMVAGVATLAAVGSLVWGLLGATGAASGLPGAGLAQAPTAAQPPASSGNLVTVSAGQISGQDATMIRNPRLDELLAAHKQFGGVSALHQSTGSLRSVSLATQRP